MWVDARERDAAALPRVSRRRAHVPRRAYLGAVLEATRPRRSAASAPWRAARSPGPGAWDGLLGGEARAALAARHPFDAEMHPTRLERYMSCPFTFLLRDVFGLDAPEEPGDRSRWTPASSAAWRTDPAGAYSAVIAGDLGLDGGAARRSPAAWEVRCAEAESRGVTGAALSWEVRRDDAPRGPPRSGAPRPGVRRGGGRPVDVEWRFGEAAGSAVTLELPGGRTVRFAGRLDRVDVTPTARASSTTRRAAAAPRGSASRTG